MWSFDRQLGKWIFQSMHWNRNCLVKMIRRVTRKSKAWIRISMTRFYIVKTRIFVWSKVSIFLKGYSYNFFWFNVENSIKMHWLSLIFTKQWKKNKCVKSFVHTAFFKLELLKRFVYFSSLKSIFTIPLIRLWKVGQIFAIVSPVNKHRFELQNAISKYTFFSCTSQILSYIPF